MRAYTSRNLSILSVFLMMLLLVSWQFMAIQSVSASPVTKMYVNPQDQTVSSSFTVDINVTDVTDLYDWEFNLNYSTSIITATSITEGPFLKSDVVSLYVSDNDDFIYKVYAADPSSSIGSWDCGTSRPYGVEYANGYVYYVDYSTDYLYQKTLAGADVASWDISSYSGDAYGLGWTGTQLLIADKGDDNIYFVNPSDPTTVASTTSLPFTDPECVAWDGTYLWVGTSGTDTVYKVDTGGSTQSSFAPAIGDINGIAHDGTNVWVGTVGNIYKYSETGTLLGTYNDPGPSCEGLGIMTSPRSTNYLNTITDASGWLNASATIVGDIPGVTGNGTLATISFDIDSAGTTDLDLWQTTLEAYNYTGDKALDRITHLRYDGSVTTTGVPEFPLGAAAEIALAGVVIYLWWRRRKTKLYKSPTQLGSSVP